VRDDSFLNDALLVDRLPAYDELLQLRGNSELAAGIYDAEAAYPGPYQLEQAAAAVIAAVATLVCDIWRLKTGRVQSAAVDMRSAAAALDSYQYLQRRDKHGLYAKFPTSEAARAAYRITRPFRTRDQHWFLPHFGMRHLKSQMLQLLGCDDTEESVACAVASRDAAELEDSIAAQGLCGCIVRSVENWLGHAQGQVLAQIPVVEIDKIADSSPEPFSSAGRPLQGIRILDLTRILAGPVAARTCAEQGAEVLMVAARHTPQIKNFVIDLSHGKRSTYLDIDNRADIETLRLVVQQSDVFSQGYRPGVFSQRGFGPEDLATLRPGLIYLSTSCFSQHGPWAMRAGWEQVAQATTGICHNVNPSKPALLPVNACDFLTGYLGAYGILLALLRRAVEGGSYHVNVSLCQSAMFLNRQAICAADKQIVALADDEIAMLQTCSETAYGSLRHLAPVARFSETPARWLLPTPVLGGDTPEWLRTH